MTTHRDTSASARSLTGHRWALPALLLGSAAIGFSPIFVRLAETPPVPAAFWRVALALPVFWLWMHWDRRRTDETARKPAGWREFGLLVLSGLVFSGDLSSWHWSISLTSIANATLLANLAPLFVTLFCWLAWRQRFSPLFLAGLVLAVGGVAGLMIGGGTAAVARPGQAWGDALSLLAAMFYASYFLVVSRLRRDFSTATIMMWSGAVTALATLALSLAAGDRLFPETWHGWAAVTGLALFSHAGGQGLIAYAMAYLPPAFTAVTVLLQPVVAVAIAWVVLGEALTVTDMAAMVTVLAGIALARRGS